MTDINNSNKYNNRRDWQAAAFGLMDVNASYAGAAASVTATSLTASGFPTTGQGLFGRMVACGPNSSGAGSTVFGVIVPSANDGSPSATVLTVDRWYNPGTLATGTTPNGTCTYQVLPGMAPAAWLAVSSSSTTPVNTDKFLASEFTTGGMNRQIAVWSHTQAATTYLLTTTWTATATVTVNSYCNAGAAFVAASSNQNGVMPFAALEPSPPTLVSGDTLTNNLTNTIN